jgi:signal transduction histidine kinase
VKQDQVVSETPDITGLVLSMSEIMGKLNTILADAIILDLGLGIAALGRDVELLMGATSEEMRGEQFAAICGGANIRAILEERLKSGYFHGLDINLWTRRAESCSVSLSGFYMGLISDINGYIILKVKLKDENSVLNTELFTKKRELDTFIYRAAHDLRGPLATIKGLVNLLKIRKSDFEVDELTNLIEVHAEKLDDRLFKLIYLANDTGHYEDGKGCVDFSVLKDILIRTLRDNCQLDKAILGFEAPAGNLCQVNDRAIMRLARHAILYIIGLPVANATEDNQLVIDMQIQVVRSTLIISVTAQGFVTSEAIRQVIKQPSSLYNDLLSHPLLFNYYVAYKEATLLRGTFSVDYKGETQQVIHMEIPIAAQLIH